MRILIHRSINLHGSITNILCRIGSSLRDNAINSYQPGPGQYNISSFKSGPKITMSSKSKNDWYGDSSQPGPGNYNVNNAPLYKNPSAFTMGAKYNSDKAEFKPGPGAYNSNMELKNNGPKIGTSTRNGLK